MTLQCVFRLKSDKIMKEITSDVVNTFLMGHDPMERIITIECDYQDEDVSIIYVNDKGEKRLKFDSFKPFAWVKHSACIRMFEGDRNTLRKKLRQYGIRITLLKTSKDGKKAAERLENGYKYLYQATRRMSFQTFMMFFQEAGTPIYGSKSQDSDDTIDDKEIMTCSPIEQYMIYSGRRLFKGYANYDDLKRMSWDIETTGLDPTVDRIEQIGIRTNKGFERVITIEGDTEEEKNANELKAIDETIRIMSEEKPDTIFGHNTEQFDWNFLIIRAKILGSSIEDISLKYFKHKIYKRKKEAILKLGGEMETYYPTVMWGHNILDSIFAVRRAMALNSDFESANLKYATRFLDLKKPNRVYVPGNEISTVWHVESDSYAFNDENGKWYKIDEKHPLQDGFVRKSGRYIVERYLLDDIWEADKVELALNGSNFALSKMLPTTFPRVCTMGTAGIWKLIMQAWSYENGLAIPATVPKRRFTGGLSRLLKTGYSKNLCKNDFNSLYPSITLTWNIQSPLDIDNIMLHLLEHILTEREKLKARKNEFGGKAKATKKLIQKYKDEGKDTTELTQRLQEQLAIKQSADSQQLAMKVIGNSFFGSYGASNLFPWGDCDCAENVTCIGRQSLRLMISHFKGLGYDPIVGDSFTSDTPLFIREKYAGMLDIKPISEIFDASSATTDGLGREYDMSCKRYLFLCKSGWRDAEYIYRHKTDKPIYDVKEGDMSISVTEDHSLFNDKHEKIKPSSINEDVSLEYYGKEFIFNNVRMTNKEIGTIVNMLKNGTIDRVPVSILNGTRKTKEYFLRMLGDFTVDNKTFQAGLQYVRKCVQHTRR